MSHVYGPHRPEDTPRTVTIQGRWGEKQEVPYPDALAQQRANINNRAYSAQHAGGGS
ncbi:MAG: hypothetical protein ACRED4_03805 [Brevundimonas sp.]